MITRSRCAVVGLGLMVSGLWVGCSRDEPYRGPASGGAAEFRFNGQYPIKAVCTTGMVADLVVFDPETVASGATYVEPARYPIGIPHVIVNGRLAILDGVETGGRAGRLLRRGD